MLDISVPCEICSKLIRLGDTTCPGCGKPVDERDRAVLQVRLEGGSFAAHDRGTQMKSASKWIGVLAIIFAISAGFAYLMSSAEVDKALANLAAFEDDQMLQPIGGKSYTAGELRERVKKEPVLLLVVNLLVAGLLGGLWIWARRAPLPAICCAFALLAVLYAVGAVLDPSSIWKGILLKIISLAVLYKGLRAALAARVAMKQRAP